MCVCQYWCHSKYPLHSVGPGLPHLQKSRGGRQKAMAGDKGRKVQPSLGPRCRGSSTFFLLDQLP